MLSEKKKCRKLSWATAHFQLCWVTIQQTYRDTGAGACSKGPTIQPGGPTTRPTRATTQPACAQKRAARARGWPGHGVSRDTNFVSWLGATVCVAIWRNRAAIRCSSALQHGVGTLRHARQRTRHGARQGLGPRYNFCIMTRGGDDTAACVQPGSLGVHPMHPT